ncbi:MAG: hybrid sensor histidine kinase/response regulator [Pseudanabaenaceae cyanobacterium bins.68]|nr:hybrid sensor histidine kinase/response regulator [Pseudanabaenaceae cyanobacterium bins.68]
MSKVDPQIRDQAYQFFRQESLDFLQTIEEGLLSLRQDRSVANIHQMMRAAHSIKGGAASVELEGIATIAHRLEDVFRGLYRHEAELDPDFENLLFQGFDLLRTATLAQIQTGSYDLGLVEESAPVFEVLTAFLGVGAADDMELPTSAELGIDIVKTIFEGDVAQGIARLEQVLANADHEEVRGEFHAQAEVFGGLGELFNLPGFKAIATTAINALDRDAQVNILELGQVIIDNFKTAQTQVLEGDRAEGGRPSPELLLFLAESAVGLQSVTYAHQESLEDIFGNAIAEDRALIEDYADLNLAEDANRELTQANDYLNFNLDDQERRSPDLLELFEDAPEDRPVPSFQLFEDAPEDRPVPSFQLFEDAPEDISEASFQLFEDLPEDISEPGFQLFEDLPEDISEPGFQLFEDLPEDISASSFPLFTQTDPGVEEIDTITPSAAIAQDHNSLGTFFDAEPLPPKPSPDAVAAPYMLETVRVDLKRLDRLSNLTGELVTQENSTLLHIQQLQKRIEQLQKRFSDFERITKGLEEWMDKSQKVSVRTTSRLADRELDPLLMDSYTGLYSLVREGLEEVLQMNEGMRDMTLLTQQVQSTQRKKQQTLKQVRSDLLWSRMIPLNDILNRFPRMVRDLSSKYQKPVELKMLGTSTLIDKATLEKLYDPLVHLIRNAFDHGADLPAVRRLAGKPETATIEIKAYHRGNQTFIEVRDDGRGIDPERVKAKAIATGLLSPTEASQINQEQIYSLLFQPDFSTADQVSEISGRGVGLSTVAEQVKSLKGTVTINSQVGIGTTFTIRLPLTLTIAKLLIFSVDNNFFALPVDSLVSIVTASDQQLQTLQGQLFYRLQDQLIPIIPTSNWSEHYPLPKRNLALLGEMLLPEESGTPVMLIASGNQVIGIPVDYIVTEQELVIKPFSKIIPAPSYLYGCTIVADGSLVPVIDGAAIVAKWLHSETRQYNPVARSVTGVIEQPTILVIDDSLTARQTLVLTLQKSGYQVVQAGDGREGLEQLDKVPNVAAVFCDVEMPQMNGFEFLATCRKQSNTSTLPVIMLTSRSGQKHREIAKLLGATSYLTKPYLEQELLQTVQSVLKSESIH